jgi:hypothetical protein
MVPAVVPFVGEIQNAYQAPCADSSKALVADVVLRRLYDISEPLPLARPKAQSFHGYREVKTHNHHARPFDPNHVERTTPVSQQESSGTISERAKRALERRLRPHTTLSAYELGHTLRISESTIWSILSGNSKTGPSGRVLQLLVDFFGATFLQEVFGGPNVHVIDPRAVRRAAHIQRIAELQAELEAM